MSYFELLSQSFPQLLTGLLQGTVKVTVISLIFATVLGLISCLFQISHSRVLKFISQAYIDIMRGVPVMVLAFFIYFGVTRALDVRMSAEIAGILTLSLNAGAYLSEIFRSGIQAVNIGQMEAARSLGLPYGTSMRRVVLPQAIRTMIPSIINQFIITLKDTSILSSIGFPELTNTGKTVASNTMNLIGTWAVIALFYLVVITILSKLAKYMERRIKRGTEKY